MDAIDEFEINVLRPILCMKQRSLVKPTMDVKDVLVLLKHHSKKDSGTILETLNIKSMRSAQNVPSIFDFKTSWYSSETVANYCKLCLTEKIYVIQSLDDKNLLRNLN